MKYIREKAIKWWNNLSETSKTDYCLEYRFIKYGERSLNYHSLTGREIEEIYLKYK